MYLSFCQSFFDKKIWNSIIKVGWADDPSGSEQLTTSLHSIHFPFIFVISTVSFHAKMTLWSIVIAVQRSIVVGEDIYYGIDSYSKGGLLKTRFSNCDEKRSLAFGAVVKKGRAGNVNMWMWLVWKKSSHVLTRLSNGASLIYKELIPSKSRSVYEHVNCSVLLHQWATVSFHRKDSLCTRIYWPSVEAHTVWYTGIVVQDWIN